MPEADLLETRCTGAVRRGVEQRRLLGIAAGLVLAAMSIGCIAWFKHDNGERTYDFQLLFYAARALRSGVNPYDAIGPGKSIEWLTKFFYPLPGVVLILPLTYLSIDAAHAIFIGLSAFFLAYALVVRRQGWSLAMIGSQAYIATVATGQWSVLYLAAFFLPWVRASAAAKPNVGLATIAATERRSELIAPFVGTLVLVGSAFLFRLNWVSDWLAAVRDTGQIYHPAVWYPGGPLLLLAWMRWRRPEARYLGCLALLPQAPGLYTDLLLFAIPRGKWEVLTLALLSHATLPIYRMLPVAPTEAERIVRYGFVSVPLLMLPCLFMVLRRPNIGPAHAKLEHMASHLPPWLRGTGASALSPESAARG